MRHPSTADKLAGPAAAPAGLSSLPAEAQWSISAALGRDQPAYHAQREGDAWRLDNRPHGLRADFTAEGVEVRKGPARFGLRLAGLGRGARVEAPSPGTPEAKANRIEYRRRGLTEWYVNGPLGLEQGFTLAQLPARARGEALTLALQLSGGMSAVPDPQGDGVALQTPQGPTLLRYRGLVAWDATGRALPAWWQGHGSEVRLRVDDAGARYPLTIDPIIEDALLRPSDANSPLSGGVAIDGDTVVVGVPGQFVHPNPGQGAAYVFVRPLRGWSGLLQESAKLTASDGRAFDSFGQSVDVDGDTVAVGARDDDFGVFGFDEDQGSAYVFVKPAGGWAGLLTEDAKLTTSDRRPDDFLGDSIAVSGDTVVVYAPGSDFGTIFNQGSAYVFVMPPVGWSGLLGENAKLVASDVAFPNLRAGDVAVNGDTVVMGTPGRDDVGTNSDKGAAYVFVKPAGGWAGLLTQQSRLTASDGRAGDFFGNSVAVSGDTVVVNTLGNSGQSAYVFVEPPGGWTGALHENARLTGSDGVNGRGAAASSDMVVLSPNVYFKPAGGWAGALTENERLTRSDGSGAFGGADVDGNTVVAGCFDAIRGVEAAWVFEGLTDAFEAKPAATRINCKTSGCRIPITCNASQTCSNRIRLLVRARDVRLREETRAKAPRLIPLASAIANIPPGTMRPVRLKLTKLGREAVSKKKKRRLQGVLEIRNTPGTAIDTTPITILLR